MSVSHQRIEEGEVYENWGHPPDKPICICEPEDYPGVGGGWDKECPIHGELACAAGDFAKLTLLIDRDPQYGFKGGSSKVLSAEEEKAHVEAHSFFNYQVRGWISDVTR